MPASGMVLYMSVDSSPDLLELRFSGDDPADSRARGESNTQPSASKADAPKSSALRQARIRVLARRLLDGAEAAARDLPDSDVGHEQALDALGHLIDAIRRELRR